MLGMLNTPSERPLKLAEMARLLGVSVAWLRAEAEAGRIPHLRAGSALLFDPEVVERIVFDRLRESPSQPKGVARGE